MRLLYSLLWWIGLPLALARLWWRGRKEPGYRHHVGERLGFYASASRTGDPQDAARMTIWVHAVSVGETRAAEPLVRALLERFPDARVLLTHMTPSGRATGASLFADEPRVLQCFLPYDIDWMVARFLRHFAPRIGILMETEVWPTMLAQCAWHQVPVVLVNARLSERSLRKALKLGAFMRAAARRITLVAAQTQADADRLRVAGASHVVVTGSIKFDITPPAAMTARGQVLRAAIGARRVLVCASTREGEEALILDAIRETPLGDALLVLVPRHPQRFDDVARDVAARGLRLQRRSEWQAQPQPVVPETQVLLGDSMGEMFAWYEACDVAFIGGSLLPLGGQNLIEACATGRPVLTGPHTFNFSVITDAAIASGAAARVPDARAMLREAVALLHDDTRRQEMGAHAAAFARQHRGATARTLDLLMPLLTAPAGESAPRG